MAVALLAAFAVAAAYDRKIAMIFIAAAAVAFLALRLVARLLMAVAAQVPRPRSTVLRLAVANIYRPGALTPTVVLSLGLGLAPSGHGPGNRRQPAPSVHGRVAGEGALVLFRRYPVGRCRALRCLRSRAGPVRRFSSGCRCCAAASSARTAFRPKIQARARRCLGAAERSRHHLHQPSAGRIARRCRRMVAPGLCRAAAGVVRQADRGGARPQARRSRSRSTCSAAISRRVSPICASSTGRSLGINFIMVYSPATFRGAPAHAHRDADLSGRRHRRGGERHAQSRGRCISVGHRGACQGRDRGSRRGSSANWCWRYAGRA